MSGMEKPGRRTYWGGLIIIGIAAAIIYWLYAKEVTIRANLLVVVVLVTIFALGIWWPMWPGRPRKEAWKDVRRFFIYCIAAFGAFTIFARVDGTVSGSGMWRVVWRWTPEKGEGLGELPTVASPKQDDGRAAKAQAVGFRDMRDFLGPARNGILPKGEFTFETDWKTNPPREVWRRGIGVGWSGFSVSQGRAVTLEQRKNEGYLSTPDKKGKIPSQVEIISCYDVLTGEPLWSKAKPATKEVDPDGMGGPGPRATPVIDGNRVYTTSGGGVLDCVDLMTGAEIWSRDVLEELKAKMPTWGKSNAPLVHGNKVIATGGTGGEAMLIAYDKESGKPLWKSGTDNGSYSSPRVAVLGGQEQIISVNQESVTGHDPGSGAVLWRFDWPGNSPKVCQPQVIGDDRVLVTAAYGMNSYLLSVQKDGDGWKVDYEWESIKTLRTKFSSASVIGDYAYAIDDGTFSCASIEDGSKQWKDGRFGYGQQVVMGDLIFLQEERRGEFILIRANPEKLEELARFKPLSSKTWNPPCLAGRYLLLRNDTEAVCYELPVKSGS